MHFWDEQQHSRVYGLCPCKICQISANAKHLILLLLLTLVWWIGWLRSIRNKTKGQILQFINLACGRTTHSYNSLAPPPHAGRQPGHTLPATPQPWLIINFSSDGEAAWHHHTASTKRCYSIGAAVSRAFYPSSPHWPYDLTSIDRIWTHHQGK